jgi:SH3 domain protein
VINTTQMILNADECFAWKHRNHYYRSTFYENND